MQTSLQKWIRKWTQLRTPQSPGLWAVALGFCFCLAQVSFALIFAPKDPVPSTRYFRMVVVDGWNSAPSPHPLMTGYLRFNNWDSLRFFELAQNGYHLPSHEVIEDDIHHYRANITTPPAYPLFARGIQKIFTIRGEVALLIASQLACWIFWSYFLLILTELKIPRKGSLLAGATVAVHPGAFYLVMGYSESFFMASCLGMIYWIHVWMKKSKVHFFILGAIHGFLGTATRVAAIPIMLYPLFKVLEMKRITLKNTVTAGFLSFFTAMGLISFLVFCQLKFGHWNLYFLFSKMVGQFPDYLAIFNPKSYIPRFFYENTMWSINRSQAPWILGLILGALRFDTSRRNKAGLYGTVIALFYFTVAGKSTGGMDGMIRYTLPIFALLVLIIAQVLQERNSIFNLNSYQKGSLTFLYLFSLATQGWISWMFLHGRWVS